MGIVVALAGGIAIGAFIGFVFGLGTAFNRVREYQESIIDPYARSVVSALITWLRSNDA